MKFAPVSTQSMSLLSARACALVCLAALAVLALAGLMQSGRSLWQDEATLLANLGLPIAQYFDVLPFYDQAAPPFALLALDAAHSLAQGSITAMRQILLGLNLGIFASLALIAYRKSDRAVLLTIAIVALTPLAVRYTVELKQYGFETLASLLFLVALRWLPNRPGTVMLLAALLSFFSYSIMLVVGVCVLDALVFRFRETLAQRWFFLLVAYTLGWLACYVLLFQPATALQTANYPSAYERHSLLYYVDNPRLLWRFLVIGRGQAYVAIACGTVALLALHLSRPHAERGITWRDLHALQGDLWQPLRVLVGLIALVLLLWLAHLYPIASDRQFLFLMPISALLLANLLLASTEKRSNVAIWVTFAATLVPTASITVWREINRNNDFQDTRGLYAFVRSQPSALILPDLLFEPSLRAYATRDSASPMRVAGWMKPESKPMDTPDKVLADLTKGNVPMHQHIWEPLGAINRFDAYVTWLVGQKGAAPEAIFAAAQFDARHEPVVIRAAQAQGCHAKEAYRSRGVVAFRISCPALR